MGWFELYRSSDLEGLEPSMNRGYWQNTENLVSGRNRTDALTWTSVEVHQILLLVDLTERLSKQFSDLFYLVKAQTSMEKRQSKSPEEPVRHTPRPLDHDQASELVGAFLAGVQVKQLARMYGIDRSTVLTHLRRFGVHRRRTKLNGPDIDRVVDLYAKGWTIAAIAVELGVGATTVRRALLKAGAEMRRRGRRT